MPPDEYRRLVENIRIDGRLTSAVLACANADGSLEILSGHHRTAAAIEIGLAEIEVIVITIPLPEERKVAIQLSHNALEGNDDPTVLAELYQQLELDAKMFSGLTDAVFDMDKLMFSDLTAGVQYEEIRVAFLAEDRETFELVLKRIGSLKRIFANHFARLADFDAVYDTVVRVKNAKRVFNSAAAIAVMAELARERLDQLEQA